MNKYRLENQLGHGSFGTVYKAEDLQKRRSVAIKIEKRNSHKLGHEKRVYNNLKNIRTPEIYSYFEENDKRYLVMELLGNNLEKIFEKNRSRFSLQTVIKLAISMIDMMEEIHKKGYVYRDVKPENFVIKNNNLYILDFGLTKKFVPKTNKKKDFVGTTRYASINAHLGIELAPRDDLESLFYTWMYFINGGLPWQGLDIKNKYEKMKKICELKQKHGFNCPEEFQKYLSYCKTATGIDYNYLRNIFKTMREKYHYNDSYDWIV